MIDHNQVTGSQTQAPKLEHSNQVPSKPSMGAPEEAEKLMLALYGCLNLLQSQTTVALSYAEMQMISQTGLTELAKCIGALELILLTSHQLSDFLQEPSSAAAI